MDGLTIHCDSRAAGSCTLVLRSQLVGSDAYTRMV